MTTEQAMAVMRSIEPLWREGMTVEEFEEETRDVARQDARMDEMRAAGWRPLSEQPDTFIDHATAKRRAQHAARNRKYRKNKKRKPN